MYEQQSHSLLNNILNQLRPEIQARDLRHFYTRLGANFYAIHSLFHRLYGQREDFAQHALNLVNILASQYIARPDELKQIDIQREQDHNWFLSQEWVGMALYTEGFAGDIKGLRDRLRYLQALGVNMIHIMPLLECPEGASDGGYAVKNFRNVDPRAGTLEDLEALAADLRRRNILLTLDVVLNHTSEEHEWAKRARSGEQRYRDFYYVFDDRTVPDVFEETMPEVFPETAPGNFSFDKTMGKWVMTVFNQYQWDLNYSNPEVFIAMLDIILFWANKGADIIRLDAVAFLWKKIGTTCQNEREAHLLLQLMKDCCQVTAPGLLFIAEAIVAPVEIAKYFGEDAIIAKECEIAYNATLMSLLWDATATRNARLLNQGVRSLPEKLDRATWLNYVRCHDDIGLGFDDADIVCCHYEPRAHRRFLVDYFSGAWDDSPARGQPFGENSRTGDARISGSLAALVGLETFLERGDEAGIDISIRQILLLHSVTLSFGGIPLIYYGDEIGTCNATDFLLDPDKARDNRWMHRPRIDWNRAERRHSAGTAEQRIFDGLRRMIAVRKSIPAFADFNNRELIDVGNEHLFVYLRSNPYLQQDTVLVVNNFHDHPQQLDLTDLGNRGLFELGKMRDLVSGEALTECGGQVLIPPTSFYWLVVEM